MGGDGGYRRSSRPGHGPDLYIEIGIRSENLYLKTTVGVAHTRVAIVGCVVHSVKELHRNWPRASTRLCTPLIRCPEYYSHPRPKKSS